MSKPTIEYRFNDWGHALADNFLKEDFNKYSGFNVKSNTKVRIGENK